MKTVRSAGIDLEFRLLTCRLQRSLHRLYLRDGNALVCFAIKTEHWCLHVRRKFGSALRPNGLLRGGIDDRAIECNPGFDVAIVGRIDPYRASPTAEANDTQLADVTALRLCPIGRGIEVGDQLGIRS